MLAYPCQPNMSWNLSLFMPKQIMMNIPNTTPRMQVCQCVAFNIFLNISEINLGAKLNYSSSMVAVKFSLTYLWNYLVYYLALPLLLYDTWGHMSNMNTWSQICFVINNLNDVRHLCGKYPKSLSMRYTFGDSKFHWFCSITSVTTRFQNTI